MLQTEVILNEREARDARAALEQVSRALSSEEFFRTIITGLPAEVAGSYRYALNQEKKELEAVLNAYEAAKTGEYSELKRRAGNDPGLALIVARIARGYSQKELARLLGLKEQQIQRYEAERYKSISLSNYKRIAQIVAVDWDMKLDSLTKGVGGGWQFATEIKATPVKKIIKHAKQHNWFEDDKREPAEEESLSYLQRYMSDHIINYGSPALLRTGLNVEVASDDLLLVAWKARITRLAENVISRNKLTYESIGIGWLNDLVRLSKFKDGPAQAKDLLLSQGIALVIEPQIEGLRLDGAAFLVGNVPVIGLTLRRDTIDNFWFTLLHEIGHIVLHYRSGLRSGFFDDTENKNIESLEVQANEFSASMLIPPEKWAMSPVRISKSVEVITKFADTLGIHPAIVFGRLQKERNNYAIFSKNIGHGAVRKCFPTNFTK